MTDNEWDELPRYDVATLLAESRKKIDAITKLANDHGCGDA